MKEVTTATIMIVTIFSAMVIAVLHVDDLPWLTYEILERIVREETNCGAGSNESSDACTQILRQIKAAGSALATAMLAIAAAISSPGRAPAAFGILAGVAAIKATYHQTMHITNGDPTLPVIILASAGILTATITIGMIWAILNERKANKRNQNTKAAQHPPSRRKPRVQLRRAKHSG